MTHPHDSSSEGPDPATPSTESVSTTSTNPDPAAPQGAAAPAGAPPAAKRGRWGRWLGLGLAGAALASAGWWWSHRAPAPEGLEEDNSPLVVKSCSTRLFDDQPALTLTLNHSVDRSQDFAKLIKVSDEGDVDSDRSKKTSASGPSVVSAAWVVSDSGRQLHFPSTQALRKYRIEVSGELKDAKGAKLADVHRCEVSSEEIGTSFYFASKGLVLPAKQNGGLPIVTVNVPEVDVQFLRVKDESLPAFLKKVSGGRDTPSEDEGEGSEEEGGHYWYGNQSLRGQASGWELEQLRERTESVHIGRYKTEASANKRRVTFLPVEDIAQLKRPGVYVAVMGQPGRFDNEYQVTHFYVTDMGLAARRFDGELDAFVTSLASGTPVKGAQVDLLDQNGKAVATAEADSDGVARFTKPPAGAKVMMARRGKGEGPAGSSEISLIHLADPALDLSEFDTGGHLPRDVKIFAWSGRDLYRPGERFQLSALARDPDGKAVAPQPLTVSIKRPDGETVGQFTWRPQDKFPGYYQQPVNIPADAPTGAWRAEFRADPKSRHADAVFGFQVEEFLPERMKLDLKTDKPVYGPGESLTIHVQGDYLYGAPAAGNRLLGQAVIERDRFAQAQKWPGFLFGDFRDDSERKRVDLTETALDDKGAADVDVELPSFSNSPIKVRSSLSLLESGGRAVVRSIERSVWPAKALVGIRPVFDRHVAAENLPASFELIRVDAQGKAVPVKGAKVKLIKEERRWYWRYVNQRGWTSGYDEFEEEVESGSTNLGSERVRVNLPVKWGTYRLEVEDPETKLTARYRFYAGWGAQDAEAMGNRPDRVLVKMLNGPFRGGDKVDLEVVPPHDGEALVTVEGTKLLYTKRLSVSAKGTRVGIPIDPSWNRHDLYITVTAFRPGSEGDKVTPARAVGLIHLPLQREERKLKVTLQAPAKVLPETTVKVKVKIAGLKPVQASASAPVSQFVTVSAVDVGILNITNFKTPDPVDFFFGKHRYAAEILDLYGRLIEKMDGQKGKLAFGGDANMRESRDKPKKVKLVDLFSGPVSFNAQGEAEVAIPVPDFNGTLRLMAVAVNGEQYGASEAQVISAAPIVAELATPRFITPGDQASLALDVTNTTDKVQEVKLLLSAQDPVAIRDGARTVSLKPQQRSILRFTAEATDAYGLATLSLKVDTDAGIHIQRQMALQVQPAFPPEHEIRRFKIDAGGEAKVDVGPVDRFFKGSVMGSVAVSNQPPMNVKSLVKGLFDYPYGCLEQTTSAAYPHLMLDEASAKAMGLTFPSAAERQRFVEGAIARLAGMQKQGGGFGLWNSQSEHEFWLSAYVTGFLRDAKDKGYAVPETLVQPTQQWMIRELSNAQRRMPDWPAITKERMAKKEPMDWRDWSAVQDAHRRFAEMAYIGYELARDRKAPLSSLRTLHDQYRARALSPLPLIHLGLALQLMGDEARAKQAFEDALTRPYGYWVDARDAYWRYSWLGDYGSRTRDLALSYALLVKHDVKLPRREQMVFDLAAELGARGSYYSTQERIALLRAAQAMGVQSTGEWGVELSAAGRSQSFKGVKSAHLSVQGLEALRSIVAKSQANGMLFGEVDVQGYPTKPGVNRSDLIEVQRSWYDMDGKPWGSRALKVGDQLIAMVQVRSKLPMPDALVVDRIPAGFEVENLNLSQGVSAESLTVEGRNVAESLQDRRIKHKEFRDDRFVVAASLDDGYLRVYYVLRVTNPGKFVVPAPFVEDMYRAELRAFGAGGQVIQVVDPRAP